MEIIYKWDIPQMDTKPQEGNLMDVVVTVHWRRIGETLVDGILYSAEAYNIFPCVTPSETDFTAYPDLTFEQVCGWLEAGIDMVVLDANIALEIDNQINPPIIILPNPWDPTKNETNTI